MVSLIGEPENAEVAWLRLVGEQVNQVERALVFAVATVFRVIGDVEQSPHVRVVPAGDVGLDVVIEAHPVEVPTALGRHVVQGRESGRAGVGVDLVVNRHEVAVRLVVAVVGVVEVERVRRPVRLGGEQVGQAEAKAPGQALDGFVAGVDQLATVLANLAVGPGVAAEEGRVGMHPAAYPIRRLVDGDLSR